jgi:hypothetical protein
MTEQDFHAAVDAAVARWHQDHHGEPLTSVVFAEAQPAQCHANAAAYATRHGGEVLHGFLVQHPHAWPQVWVMPHSVVRTGQGLIDVTLSPDELRSLGFFALETAMTNFVDMAKRFPRESRPVATALLIRMGPDNRL